MPMTHAEFVEAALRKRFPALEIEVDEWDYRNRLRCTITLDDRRWVLFTPEGIDYKSQDDRYWIHRFTNDLKQKFG